MLRVPIKNKNVGNRLKIGYLKFLLGVQKLPNGLDNVIVVQIIILWRKFAFRLNTGLSYWDTLLLITTCAWAKMVRIMSCK